MWSSQHLNLFIRNHANLWCRIIGSIGLRVLDDECDSPADYTTLHSAAGACDLLMVQILITHTFEVQSQLLLDAFPRWLPCRHQLGAV